MCPEFEMIDRQVTNDVSLFESQIPFNPPQGKLIIDPKRAVKKFRRSAAGNYELSEDLRPPEVLLATTIYLMRDVLGDEKWPSNGVPFSVLYAFIRDRLRAIRTDLTLQNCKNIQSIRIHELSIRFLIAAGHLLCEEERAAFEPQQNNEQLNGCLSALREMYKAVRLSGTNTSDFLKYEAEFQAYSIILSVDKKEAALAISSLPLSLVKSGPIQVALEAFSAFQQTNYIKFLGLIRDDPRTTYLQSCLLHQFVLPVRQRALSALVSSDSYKIIPKDDIMRWLSFVDDAELFYYSERFGFRILPTNQIDLTSLIQRGEAQDLRAEEENFKVRQFYVAIEEKRRKKFGLSHIMFEGIDLDLNQVMIVLERGHVNNFSHVPVTSEFLASASSSPKPPKQHFKKSFPSSSSNLKVETTVDGQLFSTAPIEATTLGTLSTSSVDFKPEAPKIDHQAILKKKLEAQAQERQARKERIDSLSIGMLDALIDSIIGNYVAESCTISWEQIRKESNQNRKINIEIISKMIFENLIEKEIIPSVLDVELMKLRCRAAESLSTKFEAIEQAKFSILSTLEQEIYNEIILETFLNFKAAIFVKRKFFKALKFQGKENNSKWNEIFDSVKNLSHPVHIILIGSSGFKSLLEPLIKSNPPNSLGYLQSFINHLDLKIIWSTSSVNPFLLSFLEMNSDGDDCLKCVKSNWPSNFPGPTVIISEFCNDKTVNMIENTFPWTLNILKMDPYSLCFKDILSKALSASSTDLPIINENVKPSDFIPEELIESFVIEPFERDSNYKSEELLINLLRGFLDRLIWILFRNPKALKLFSCHPKIAGKSRTIESIRNSQNIPETFIKLFKSNKSIQTSLNSLDQIYGNSFTIGSLECLYTTQSISDFVRNQNEIINRHCKRIRYESSHEIKTTSSPISSPIMSIDVLKEKLKNESSESGEYEQFLKKYL